MKFYRQDDRPIYEQKIIKTKVLKNPFPDIIPRTPSSSKELTISKDDDTKRSKESGVKYVHSRKQVHGYSMMIRIIVNFD